MQKFLLIPLGICAAALGVLGLVIPVIPGFLFLLAAGLCFALAVPTLRTKLSQMPRFNRLFRRIDRTANQPIGTRLRMTFWALLEAAFPKNKVDHH